MKLGELKVNDLKKELEERELETTGLKTVLQSRLSQALIDAGENPHDYLFDIPCGISDIGKLIEESSRSFEQKLMESSKILKKELIENSKNLETKLEENSSFFKRGITAKLEKNSKMFKEELEENSRKNRIVNIRFRRSRCYSRSNRRKESSMILVRQCISKHRNLMEKSSWPNYLKQFEAVAKAHNWTPAEMATALTVSMRGEAIESATSN
ncbi:hypothetical protein CBL_21310 [Carabus blaptoides fortunei]